MIKSLTPIRLIVDYLASQQTLRQISSVLKENEYKSCYPRRQHSEQHWASGEIWFREMGTYAASGRI